MKNLTYLRVALLEQAPQSLDIYHAPVTASENTSPQCHSFIVCLGATLSSSDLVTYTSGAATTEAREVDPPSETENDVDVCTTFVHKTCGCTKANGKPCSILFLVDYIDYHAQASLFKRQELDLLLLGST